MSAADKRVDELLARWQASLDLHAKYLALDDAAYAKVEDWPKHQRPTKWVIGVAQQRLGELRAHLGQRRDAGDAAFAESLELMSFLTSLLGSEHIERFIPLATGKKPDPAVSGTVEQPRVRVSKPKTTPARAPATGRVPQRAAAPRSTTPPATPATAAAPTTHDRMSRQVVADAVRMLEWGREWPALAGLIARMADRPSEAEVWKILRAHRAEILTKARRPTD
jgi:hypothetical protein